MMVIEVEVAADGSFQFAGAAVYRFRERQARLSRRCAAPNRYQRLEVWSGSQARKLDKLIDT